MLALMLMVQTIPVPSPQPVVGPILPKLPGAAEPGCQRSDDDIVVCGKTDNEQYRLRPIGPPPNSRVMPPATIPIGQGTADLRAVQRALPNGASAPAAMVTLKLPF